MAGASISACFPACLHSKLHSTVLSFLTHPPPPNVSVKAQKNYYPTMFTTPHAARPALVQMYSSTSESRNVELGLLPPPMLITSFPGCIPSHAFAHPSSPHPLS